MAPILTKELNCKSCIDNKFLINIEYIHKEDENKVFGKLI